MYTETININGPQNQKHVYITLNKQSFISLMEYETPIEISRQDAKDFLKEYFKKNFHFLKKKIIRIGYITNHGTVNNNINIVLNDDNDITATEWNNIMRDPKTNKHEESGEYNNNLQGKTIYGLSIALFDLLPVSAVKPKKSRSKFKFNF